MLRITQSDLDTLRAHGERAYPHECCGILLGHTEGDERVVSSVVPCGNASDSPRTRYEINPEEVVRAQRESRARGLEIIGFYHSHPDHPAQFSPTDLSQAYWPGCSYLVVGVTDGHAGDVKCFLLTETDGGTRFEEEPIATYGLERHL